MTLETGSALRSTPQSPTGSSELLVVRDLRRSFGSVRAVENATFEVQEGSICGLIGPNGAGKSTALAMISGALRPDGGSIVFAGEEIHRQAMYRVARRGIVRTFQIAGVFDQLTVLENLLVGVQGMRGETLRQAMLGKRYWRADERLAVARARELLERFDLGAKEDERAGTLSGGQKRLTEIMRALMANPRLLLLDEPTAGVAPTMVHRMQSALEDLRSEGITMLMVEHSLGVVERLCDHVIVMAQGRTFARGTMAELRERQDVRDAYLLG
jgi:ABC-type branched-subunit amino acid transport system ATPase component